MADMTARARHLSVDTALADLDQVDLLHVATLARRTAKNPRVTDDHAAFWRALHDIALERVRQRRGAP